MKKKNETSGKLGFGSNRNQVNKETHQQSERLQGTEKLVDEALAKFGVEKKPRFSQNEYEKLGPYDRLVSRFGATTLQSFESVLLVTSSVLVIVLRVF
ncbi:hypothetical protein Gasu2_38140 [Galdieria sulphuraria]|nr:hypothetical protein Gasu2_38140 [Galdieria sulphuraria]